MLDAPFGPDSPKPAPEVNSPDLSKESFRFLPPYLPNATSFPTHPVELHKDFGIIRQVVTPWKQNARIIFCTQTSEAVCIDPGAEGERLAAIAKDHNLKLNQVWLTHAHPDHCGGVKDLLRATGAQLSAHGHFLERWMRYTIEAYVRLGGMGHLRLKNCPEPQRYLAGGEDLQVGHLTFKALYTPGHSPGHLCFFDAAHELLVSGDALFKGGIGPTKIMWGSRNTLKRTLENLSSTLLPSVRVLGGHRGDSILAEELKSNIELKRILAA